MVLDIFSRYVVGWMVATQENSRLAKALIAQSYSKQAIVSEISPSMLIEGRR